MNLYFRLKICLEDVDFAENIKRRFSELGSGIVYTYGDDFDLILTDSKKVYNRYENSLLLTYGFDSDFEGRKISYLLGSRRIYDFVISQYESIYETYFVKSDENMKVYNFLSPLGGSGLSSVSYSFSRKLAHMGYRVLLTSLYESPQLYIGKPVGELCSAKKLEYLLAKKERVPIRNFVFHAEENLDLLDISSEGVLGSLLSVVGKSGLFDIVVLASKADKTAINGDRNYLILSEKDLRTEKLLKSDEYDSFTKIVNRTKNAEGWGDIRIREDDNAFKLMGDKISIERGTMFDRAIDLIVKEAVND